MLRSVRRLGRPKAKQAGSSVLVASPTGSGVLGEPTGVRGATRPLRSSRKALCFPASLCFCLSAHRPSFQYAHTLIPTIAGRRPSSLWSANQTSAAAAAASDERKHPASFACYSLHNPSCSRPLDRARRRTQSPSSITSSTTTLSSHVDVSARPRGLGGVWGGRESIGGGARLLP